MSDNDKPDPIEDVRKGLGLLFRAAKGAIDSLPKGKLEQAVQEVGRAIENVTTTIDKQLFRRDAPPAASTKPAEGSPPSQGVGKDGAKANDAPPPEQPKGPRVA